VLPRWWLLAAGSNLLPPTGWLAQLHALLPLHALLRFRCTSLCGAAALGGRSDCLTVCRHCCSRLDQTSLPLNGVYSPGDLSGSSSHVYLLDTGVRGSHVDFSGRLGEGTSMLGGTTGTTDPNGHGTHAAGGCWGGLPADRQQQHNILPFRQAAGLCVRSGTDVHLK
jgi:hypothetical protein